MMPFSRVLFSSQSGEWETPEDLYEQLDREFGFTDDPCPVGGTDGLTREWGTVCFVNPPYGRDLPKWLAKSQYEMDATHAWVVVFLLPARTDTAWFHDAILPHATEIRFLRGRLRFSGHRNSAPFPSMIVVFLSEERKAEREMEEEKHSGNSGHHTPSRRGIPPSPQLKRRSTGIQ